VAACLALGPGSSLYAQQDTIRPDSARPDSTQAQPPGSPVVIRDDTLFRLVAPMGPFTPAERARAITRRVDSLTGDPLRRTASLSVVDTAGVTDIRLGEFVVMSVIPGDAAVAGVERRVLADRWAARIQSAIRGRERAVTIGSVALGALKTLAATVVLILLFQLFRRVFPALRGQIEAWQTARRIPSVRIQRLELLSADSVTEALLGLTRGLRVIAVVFVLYLYVPLVLSFFPWTAGLSTTLFDWILEPLGRAGRGFVGFLPDLFTILVIGLVVNYLLKFIRLFFDGIARRKIMLEGFYQEWAVPTYKIVRFMVLVFALVMIYPYLPGSSTAAFQGISVFLGLLISFGSASAIANVVAGIVMTYMRPFLLGDRVKIADTTGDVIERTLLVTRVRTIKNVDVTIPNAMVLSSHIINFSSSARERGLVLHTSVTIGYDAPWRQVHELLVAAAAGTTGIKQEPPPFVLQTGLDDFYVRYELNAYTDDPGSMARTYSELHQAIQDRFNEAGVEIMSPHYGALRDGNQVTIPADHLPASYRAPGFRWYPLRASGGEGGS
jgi:small-conductance mechanosensitive channel